MKPNDGGPAFPHVRRTVGLNMEERITDGGMSLRDWFAGQALVGILAHNCDQDEAKDLWNYPVIARWAFDAADAMLAERANDAGAM